MRGIRAAFERRRFGCSNAELVNYWTVVGLATLLTVWEHPADDEIFKGGWDKL